MSECDQRRDDRSRAGAGDIIEIIRENELWIPATFAQLRFYPWEDFDIDNSANAATVACEQFPRAGLIQFVAVSHCRRFRVRSCETGLPFLNRVRLRGRNRFDL